jgi:hypothetical protein
VDLRAPSVRLALLGHKVGSVQQGQLARRVQVGRRALSDRQVCRALMGSLARVDLPAPQGRVDPKGTSGQADRPEPSAQPGLQAPLGYKALLDLPDRWALLARLALMVPQARKASPDPPGRMAAPPGPRVRKATWVQRARLAPRVPRARQAHRVSAQPGLRVSPVPLAPLAQLGPQGLLGRRARSGLRASLVLPDPPAQRGHRVSLAISATLVLPGP